MLWRLSLAESLDLSNRNDASGPNTQDKRPAKTDPRSDLWSRGYWPFVL